MTPEEIKRFFELSNEVMEGWLSTAVYWNEDQSAITELRELVEKVKIELAKE